MTEEEEAAFDDRIQRSDSPWAAKMGLYINHLRPYGYPCQYAQPNGSVLVRVSNELPS
jgi:hypothetical protein